MNKIKYRGRVLASAALILVGLFFYLCLAGYSFISYTCWALALVILFYWVMKLIAPKYPKTERILNKIASYLVIFFCMVFAVTEGALIYGGTPAESTDTDYAVVLGAGLIGTSPSKSLTYRLEAAYEYLEANPNAVCVCSGSQADDEEISEAECMRLWLENAGIAPDRIIKEEEARNTLENIENSVKLITDISGKKPEKVAIITAEYHMLRASLMMKNLDVEPVSVPATTKLPVMAANYYIREAFALWKYLLIG